MSISTKLNSLKDHSGFIRYFKNTSWLIGDKVIRMTVGLFVGIWVARYLGPERFGLFSYAQSFVGLFVVIATLGLDAIVVRELVKNESKRDALLGTAFVLQLAGAFIVLLILAIAINFTSNNTSTNILIFIIASATIFQSFNVIDYYFQSKVLSKYVVYANMITLLISSIIKIALIINEAPLVTFAYVILFDSIILSLGFLYFYLHAHLSFRTLKFEGSLAISLLKDSWPLILSGVVISIYMKIDQVMIKEMLGPGAVGQYAAAARLSEAWYFIPVVICSSLFPALINIKKQSKELYYARLQKLYDLMVWLGIAVALPLAFFSDWIVGFLYGEQYSQAGSVLVIHIWAGVFVFLGVACGKYLTAENLTKKYFHRTLFGAILNIVLNYVLIPKYGISGAALATLTGQIAANYLYDFFDPDLHSQLRMKTKSFFPIHLLRS